MRCANPNDDQLWRLIAENTEKLSALIRQQIELDDAEYSAAIYPRARADLICFASRYQREYRQYADELRRRHLSGVKHRVVQALIESKDALPVVLHADDGPAVLVRLIVERLGKGAGASNAKEKAAIIDGL